jgi:3-hydroxy-9,10-secoandrosta-1,3,5(10)-triene-9,17-dione monooxygenase reductase component
MARDFCHSTSGQTHVQVVGIVFNARGCIAVQEPSHKGDETMHTFSEREFRDAVGGFCTGVVVVTGLFENEPAGFTAQSFVSVSLSPPLVAICPSKTSSSWQKVRRSGHFGVNLLPTDGKQLSAGFSNSQSDKFLGHRWTQGKTGSPILPGVISFIDCRIEVEHDAGDHTIVVGRVLDIETFGADSAPLLFFRGTYGCFSDLQEVG